VYDKKLTVCGSYNSRAITHCAKKEMPPVVNQIHVVLRARDPEELWLIKHVTLADLSMGGVCMIKS